MNRYFLLTFSYSVALSMAAISFGQQFTVELYRHETQGGHTNVWHVSSDVLAKMPKWMPGKEPPLSLGKAVQIAKNRIISAGGNQDLWIYNIEIRPVFPGANVYGNAFYYNISFGGASLLGHYRRCILLMDGTIIEPDWLGPKPKNIASWSYDE